MRFDSGPAHTIRPSRFGCKYLLTYAVAHITDTNYLINVGHWSAVNTDIFPLYTPLSIRPAPARRRNGLQRSAGEPGQRASLPPLFQLLIVAARASERPPTLPLGGLRFWPGAMRRQVDWRRAARATRDPTETRLAALLIQGRC